MDPAELERWREVYIPGRAEENREKRELEALHRAWREEEERSLAACVVDVEERKRQRRALRLRPWTEEDVTRQAAAVEACRVAYRGAGEKRAALAGWATGAEAWLSAQLVALPGLLADHRDAMAAAGAASGALDVTRSRVPTREARAAVLRDHAIDTTGAEPYWASRHLQSPDVAILLRAALGLLAALREDRWVNTRQWRDALALL